MKDRINYIEKDSKNKNTRDLYTGRNKFGGGGVTNLEETS
jgi:hypothetical protein